MYQDAAAVGVFAFDWYEAAGVYRAVAMPASAVRAADTPAPIRELLVVRPLKANFASGQVGAAEVR